MKKIHFMLPRKFYFIIIILIIALLYLSSKNNLAAYLINKENVCRISISSIGVRSSNIHEFIVAEDDFYDALNGLYDLEVRRVPFKPESFNENYTYLITLTSDSGEISTLYIIGNYLTLTANQTFKICSAGFADMIDALQIY